MTQNTALSSAPLQNFEALGLLPALCKAVQRLGFNKPTLIQQKGLPALLKNKDVLLPSQTGSGKTATFLLAALQKLAEKKQKEGEFYQPYPQILILEPTRDLATQTAGVCRQLGRDIGVKTRLICGGTSREQQLRSLEGGVEIIIATHGRLLDFVQNGQLDLSHIEYLVLDEADRLLDEEFSQSMTALIPYLADHPQTIFCSATLPDTVMALAKKVTRNPVQIEIEEETKTPRRLQQRAIFLHDEEKESTVQNILTQFATEDRIIVFVNTKKNANELAKKVRSWGFKAESFHSERSQGERKKVLDHFQGKQCAILVTTDIAARGLDIDNVSIVINFDLPKSSEIYIHRIGRSARAGKKGKALSLITFDQRHLLRDIEKNIQHRIRIITPDDLTR
ncbi:DEAD/DEAH box helicase [Aristophania vespae]|uniref:DEAD/DEAH box helicase n=1 Tax=Aristophania vespae TaxID=2697033 RepID=UPI002351A51E|nr:DEAD/DEAH box helicase [Aristophania vespae]UMM63071.1 ATP-dependent RNA helicase RhlE [Aristophania vespae]